MNQQQRKKAISKIKIAQRQLDMSEADYQKNLQDYGGLKSDGKRLSATALDDAGIEGMMRRMKALGFKPTRPAKAGRLPHLSSEKAAQGEKIQALLAALGKSTAYAEGIAKQMYQREKLEFCTVAQLRGVITALEKAKQKQVTA